MKKLQKLLLALGVCLAIVSCSKEEVFNEEDLAGKASISFGAILQDLESNRLGSKQALDELPECSESAPGYVRIILSRNGVNVVGSEQNPFRIDLVANQIYTEYVPELKLDPGTYSLDYFGVYNAGGELIWLAPQGQFFNNYLENPMPVIIELDAGVKKYVDVSVVCFDNRIVNEYGYIFFDLEPNRIIQFCIFGNYCNEAGRHYPASYSVNVWLYSNGATGAQLYSNVISSVTLNSAGDYAASPLCFALPDTPGLDQYYFEIKLLNSDAYADVTEAVIRSGVITDGDVRNLFAGTDATEYYHFIEGACNGSDSPVLFDIGGPGLTAQYDDEVATAWFNLLAGLSKNTFYFPPQSARLFAYSGLALYESVLPGMPAYQSVFADLSGQTIPLVGNATDYYWPASANAAVAELARKLLKDYPQPVNLAAINQLETALRGDFPASITQEQMERSVEFGKQVADAIYQWSKTDGTFTPCPPYSPLGGPGNWVPTPPAFIPGSGACLDGLRTFVPGIAAALLPAPPPPYSTDPASAFYQMNLEIYEISQSLTADDHRIIQAWRDNPPLNYNGMAHIIALATDILEDENKNLGDAAVLYAKLGIAMYDAIPAVMNAKYEYSLQRPITYIRSVMGHTEWTSVYPAPPHPSYPSIGLGVNTAGLTILEAFFGSNYAFEDATQEALHGIFYYTSFAEMIEDIGLSRTHSGINYRISVEVGEEIGRAVGEQVNAMDFEK